MTRQSVAHTKGLLLPPRNRNDENAMQNFGLEKSSKNQLDCFDFTWASLNGLRSKNIRRVASLRSFSVKKSKLFSIESAVLRWICCILENYWNLGKRNSKNIFRNDGKASASPDLPTQSLPNPNEKAIELLQALKSNPKRLLGNFNRIAGTWKGNVAASWASSFQEESVTEKKRANTFTHFRMPKR